MRSFRGDVSAKNREMERVKIERKRREETTQITLISLPPP